MYHNANYLCGLFKRETGETIHTYILRKRVEEAEYYVRHSSDPSRRSPHSTSFCSQSHFVQCFRKFMGKHLAPAAASPVESGKNRNPRKHNRSLS